MGIEDRLGRIHATLPAPSLCIVLRQFALQHVNNVFPDDGHELETVVGAAGCDVEVLGFGVGADSEVKVFGVAVPRFLRQSCSKREVLKCFLPAHPGCNPLAVSKFR